MSKRLMYVNRRAPHGTVYAQESRSGTDRCLSIKMSRWHLSMMAYTSCCKVRMRPASRLLRGRLGVEAT